jgi:hypothetical protein
VEHISPKHIPANLDPDPVPDPDLYKNRPEPRNLNFHYLKEKSRSLNNINRINLLQYEYHGKMCQAGFE